MSLRAFSSLLVVLTLGFAAAAAGQKSDLPYAGPAKAPTFKASENTNYDVTNGLPHTVTGALDPDDSTYNREAGDCGGISGIGTDVFYDTITLTNTSGILAKLDVTTSDVGNPASCSSGDTFLTAYSPTFNAVSPATNCVTSNDDGGPGVCSALSFDLAVGQTAILVVTSFANGAQFPYQVNVSSPSCSDGIVYDDGSFESGLHGPMGTDTFEITQRFDLPLIGSGGAEVLRICACLGHTVSAVNDFLVNFVVRRPNTAGTMPGSRLKTESVMVMDVPAFPMCQFFTVDLTGVTFDSDRIFVGVEWSQSMFPELLISEDTTGATSQPSFYTTNLGGSWSPASGLDPGYRNLGVRATFDEPFTALAGLNGLLLPGFQLDLNDPDGPTSFLNVRNTTESTLEVNVYYYGEEVTDTPRRVDGVTLASNRVAVEDIGSDTTDLDPDGDDIASGLILANRSDTNDGTDLEGDFLNVDFSNDFASGDRLFRIPDDFCNLAEIRFLDFGSGTKLSIIINQPKGDVAPSFTYTAYNQAGAVLVADAEYSTNTHLNVVDVADLVGMSNHFGTIVFDFSKAGGGMVIGKYSAFGRFSVEFNSACRD